MGIKSSLKFGNDDMDKAKKGLATSEGAPSFGMDSGDREDKYHEEGLSGQWELSNGAPRGTRRPLGRMFYALSLCQNLYDSLRFATPHQRAKQKAARKAKAEDSEHQSKH